MITRNCSVYLVLLFVFIFTSLSNSQEAGEIESYPVEAIQDDENLIDSNEVYKKQFDSLSKDGEWIEVDKSEFLQELNNLTGEEISYEYPYYTNILYFWRPFVANSYWNPYMNGGWTFSDYGWVWLSNYSWGWGPYNYGRWYFSNMYGWLWLPGNVWAANWVYWRYNGINIGWYPCYPNYYHGNVSQSVKATRHYNTLPKNWVFVRVGDFTKMPDDNVMLKSGENADILKNSEVVSASLFSESKMKFTYSGPDVNTISKATGKKIIPKQIVGTDLKRKPHEYNSYITTYVNREIKLTDTPFKTDDATDGKSNANNPEINYPRNRENKAKEKQSDQRSYESGSDYIFRDSGSDSNSGSNNTKNESSTKTINRSDGSSNTNSNDVKRNEK